MEIILKVREGHIFFQINVKNKSTISVDIVSKCKSGEHINGVESKLLKK